MFNIAIKHQQGWSKLPLCFWIRANQRQARASIPPIFIRLCTGFQYTAYSISPIFCSCGLWARERLGYKNCSHSQNKCLRAVVLHIAAALSSTSLSCWHISIKTSTHQIQMFRHWRKTTTFALPRDKPSRCAERRKEH